MAFLDFIKNREGQRPVEQQQKPETAKEMYAQKAVDDRAALKPLDRLPEQSKVELADAKARFEKGTQNMNQGAPTPTPAPSDSTASPEAMRQGMANQDKATPELSPTSMQAGKTTPEKEVAAPAMEQPKPTPTPSPSHTPSPHGRGGWER
jgi:hypothetical protein